MTLTELAKLANVSISTASKAFSGSHEISRETRDRIFDVARENGCFDKYYKGPRENPLIALIVPESESEYYGRDIGILERELSNSGADTVIALTRFDKDREARLFREMTYRMGVDGVVLIGSGEKICNRDEIPLIKIGGTEIAENADQIYINYEGGMAEIVSLIKEYGHKRVGFFGEKLTDAKQRMFRKAMRQAGLPIMQKYILTSTCRFEKAGEDCMKRLIEIGNLPSVIIAAYDQIAIGAMKYAKSRGYKIPEDISFVGMDDISATDYLEVPLTSIHVHTDEVCREVVNLMFKRIKNHHYRENEKISIPVAVNLRKSLGKCKEK